MRLFFIFRLYHLNMFMLIGFGVGFVHNSKEFILFRGDILLCVFLLYVIVSLRYSSTLTKFGYRAQNGSFSILFLVFFTSGAIVSGLSNLVLLDFG